jgi:type II secretory pathway component GspD/PulD (secretin)
MFRKNLCLGALIVLSGVGMACVVVTTAEVKANEETLEIFPLRYCQAKAAVEVIESLIGQEKGIRIAADEVKNRVLVIADPDDMKLVREILSKLERDAQDGKSATESPLSCIPDLDPDKMTDAEMRQAVVALTKQVRQLAVRVRRLEEANKPRIVPLSEEQE